MKRVRCPKCDKFLSFDETKYSEGQSLVFECDECGKQFSIRIGKSKLKETQKNEKPDESAEMGEFGCITVIENIFGFKQVFPLEEGDNYIGRRSHTSNAEYSWDFLLGHGHWESGCGY